MIRTQEMVPDYYIEASRDFQVLCRLYDFAMNSLKFNIDSMQELTDTRNIKDTVLLTTDKHICCGEKVTVSGIIKDMPQSMNENGFNMARHYKSKNIYTRMYSEEIEINGKWLPFGVIDS